MSFVVFEMLFAPDTRFVILKRRGETLLSMRKELIRSWTHFGILSF